MLVGKPLASSGYVDMLILVGKHNKQLLWPVVGLNVHMYKPKQLLVLAKLKK